MKRKSTIFLAGAFLIAGAALALYEGVRPWRSRTIITVSPSTADRDGFEVIVYKPDGNPIAQSLHLPDARKFIEVNSSATFLLPQKDIELVQAALQKAEDANGGASPVTVSATDVAPGKQDITLYFHYGNRTFFYNYEAADRSISPRSASEFNLTGEKRTLYR